jgi:hypothetical protein
MVIPRDHVHSLSEGCAANIERFQVIAKRLLDSQPRLVKFFRDNMSRMPGKSGEVSLYLLAVILHVFASTGQLKKVGETDIQEATIKILSQCKGFLPANADFPAKVRQLSWRAQEHLLDEALYALFERTERKDVEVDIPMDQAGIMFMMLWAATEALNSAWSAQPDKWAGGA